MSDYDGSRGYGSSGDRDSLLEAEFKDLIKRIEKLEIANVALVEPNSDVGDEFVRKKLIRAYEICETRDQLPLEYVIRMFSDPTQWKEFSEKNNLKSYHILGE